MKKIFTLLVLMAASSVVLAQQEYTYTFFPENRNFINPAAAGTAEYGSLTGMFRKQWAGVEGTPTSGGLTFDMPIGKNMGVGALVYQDNIGVTSQTNIGGMYSYHLKLARDHYLAFGVTAGMDLVNTKYDRLVYWDANDLLLAEDYVNVVVPHIGFGAQYFWKDLYVGLSIPRMISVNSDQFNSINFSDAPSLVTHYYFSAGYHFRFKNDLSLKPSLLMKYTNNAPMQADINLTMYFKEMLGFGVAYKSLGFLSTFMSYNIKDVIVIGYGFDFSMNALQGYSKGTHEVMLQWRFNTGGSGGSSRL